MESTRSRVLQRVDGAGTHGQGAHSMSALEQHDLTDKCFKHDDEENDGSCP